VDTLIFKTTTYSVDSKMAERMASGIDDRQNFEHGVVSSDAVYVPRPKQSSRGPRGRGNYRHGNQQNGSVDRSEYGGSKQSGDERQYGAGRGRKGFGQRGHYYGRRNPHSAAYEYNRTSFTNSSSVDNCYSEPTVDRSALYSASADAGGYRMYSDESEFNEPSFHVRENVRSSRASRNDRRYEERSQKHDFHPIRGARNAYRRGRGYRGSSNYCVDDRFGMSSSQDMSAHSNISSKGDAGFEVSTDLRDVTEFSSNDRRKFVPNARISSNEKLIPKDDKYAVYPPAAVSQYIPDEQQFQHLRISTDAASLSNDIPGKGNNQVAIDARMKNADPEFETQRGCSFFT